MIASLSATLANRRSETERLHKLVETFSEQHELSDPVVFAVNLALDEIVTNIIVHGYSDNQQHDIRVGIVLGEDAIEVTVRDEAPAFNPLLVPPVDLEAVA
jgi:serine/threonine-protein kinase RsbW